MGQLRKLRRTQDSKTAALKGLRRMAYETLFPEGAVDDELAKDQVTRYLSHCRKFNNARVTLLWHHLYNGWRAHDPDRDGPSRLVKFVQGVLDNRAEQSTEAVQ